MSLLRPEKRGDGQNSNDNTTKSFFSCSRSISLHKYESGAGKWQSMFPTRKREFPISSDDELRKNRGNKIICAQSFLWPPW
jgi:hypothetical protein